MNKNDAALIRQMMLAGKYNAVLDFMPTYNLEKSKAIIKEMGNKWCCHPDNHVKKLDVPIEILNQNKSKVLKGKK
jgi:hypothetical protein